MDLRPPKITKEVSIVNNIIPTVNSHKKYSHLDTSIKNQKQDNNNHTINNHNINNNVNNNDIISEDEFENILDNELNILTRIYG